MKPVIARPPPIRRADGHGDLTGQAGASALGRVVQRIAIRCPYDQDVQVGGRTTLLPGVAGSPGPEQIGALDARHGGEFLGQDLARAERAQQQVRQRRRQRRRGGLHQSGIPYPPGGHHPCLLGPGLGPVACYGTVTGWMTTAPRVGLSSVACDTPGGVMTSIALGTGVGSTEQMGAVQPGAHTPSVYAPGVAVKARARSELKPSWPVRTTLKPQPEPG